MPDHIIVTVDVPHFETIENKTLKITIKRVDGYCPYIEKISDIIPTDYLEFVTPDKDGIINNTITIDTLLNDENPELSRRIIIKPKQEFDHISHTIKVLYIIDVENYEKTIKYDVMWKDALLCFERIPVPIDVEVKISDDGSIVAIMRDLRRDLTLRSSLHKSNVAKGEDKIKKILDKIEVYISKKKSEIFLFPDLLGVGGVLSRELNFKEFSNFLSSSRNIEYLRIITPHNLFPWEILKFDDELLGTKYAMGYRRQGLHYGKQTDIQYRADGKIKLFAIISHVRSKHVTKELPIHIRNESSFYDSSIHAEKKFFLDLEAKNKDLLKLTMIEIWPDEFAIYSNGEWYNPRYFENPETVIDAIKDTAEREDRYDILHFAGEQHIIEDNGQDTNVFLLTPENSVDVQLTPNNLNEMFPKNTFLIFGNFCNSAKTRRIMIKSRKIRNFVDVALKTANVYIGSSIPVNSLIAGEISKFFYERMLIFRKRVGSNIYCNETVGKALLEAKREIFDRINKNIKNISKSSASWALYAIYGDPRSHIYLVR